LGISLSFSVYLLFPFDSIISLFNRLRKTKFDEVTSLSLLQGLLMNNSLQEIEFDFFFFFSFFWNNFNQFYLKIN